MIYVMAKIKKVAIFWFHTSTHFNALMIPNEGVGYQLKEFRERKSKNLLVYSTYTHLLNAF